MKVEITFYPDGTFHCDGLGITRRVRIGGKANPNEPGCEVCPRFKTCGMSETTIIATSIKDLDAIKEACKALGLKEPRFGMHRLYGPNKKKGYAVTLDGWSLPIVIDTDSGEIHYDNYHEGWGKTAELNKFKQAYGVAKAKLIAKKNRYGVKTITLKDGAIRVIATDATHRSITTDVSPTGDATIDGKGFKGKECDAKMKVFEQGLGKVTSRHCKVEYYQQTEVKNQQKAGQ